MRVCVCVCSHACGRSAPSSFVFCPFNTVVEANVSGPEKVSHHLTSHRLSIPTPLPTSLPRQACMHAYTEARATMHTNERIKRNEGEKGGKRRGGQEIRNKQARVPYACTHARASL